MRISISTFLSIFVFGWFAGTIFVLIYFSLFENIDEKATKIKAVSITRKFLKSVAFYDQLPKFVVDEKLDDVENHKMLIFLDWPLDDYLFNYYNYKALETLLSIYPKAIFRCLLATSLDIYTYKTGDFLSLNQFLKYKKRDYDIEVVPIGNKKSQKAYMTSFSSIGQAYREKWLAKCCNRCGSNIACNNNNDDKQTLQQVQPFHLLNYIRLTKLWSQGGIFTDFSFLFLGQLSAPHVQQVFFSILNI
jgi:hypothetical protein